MPFVKRDPIVRQKPEDPTRSKKVSKEKYGAFWDYRLNSVRIEMACIRKGGQWVNKSGVTCGLGLFKHYHNLQEMLWPNLDDHRWNSICLEAMSNNQVSVLMGPASSGKTHSAAKFGLCDYFCAPEDTIVLVSSTDLRGLELRVWGEIKMLFKLAKERFDWLPGSLIDSKHCISSDDIQQDEVRDLRKGIIGIPCIVNNRFIGLGKYVGIKQKRVRLLADEAQFMQASFLESITNLDKNPDFKAVIMGNPLDPMDSLGKAAEPENGWDSIGEPEKTETWKTRFKSGICVNLVGTDSPNFDYPEEEETRFPYLISRQSIESTVKFYSKDSQQYYSQCKGVMKSGLMARRVITRELCRKNNAHDQAIWKGTPNTRIYASDIAYGSIGGDRCIGGWGEFGHDVDGNLILEVKPPEIVPVSVRNDASPEDQIAEHCKTQCEFNDIPPSNFFYDSTGRGSMGTAFARIWSADVNPVEFGGQPSDRPVCQDLFILDEKTRQTRLKLCSEHYSKRVTEFWFSVRYCIESGQLRGLTREVMEEGCMREWKMVRGDKIEIEAKDETKERMGRSPDLFDWLVTVLEGARRRGFKISRMAAANSTSSKEKNEFMERMKEKAMSILRRHELTYR